MVWAARLTSRDTGPTVLGKLSPPPRDVTHVCRPTCAVLEGEQPRQLRGPWKPGARRGHLALDLRGHVEWNPKDLYKMILNSF